MKKFQFSLEKVKSFRETEEKFLQKELIEAQRTVLFLQEKLETAKLNLSKEQAILSHITSNQHSSTEFLQQHTYIQTISQEIFDLKSNISNAEKKVKTAREKLLDKTKEKKSLEKLEEMKKNEYLQKFQKKEQEDMDEIAIRRAFYGGNK